MNEKEIKIAAPVILSFIGVFLSIASIAYSIVFGSVNGYFVDGYITFAFIELVAFVLFIAGLTTKKIKLLRVFSLIINCFFIVTSFVFVIIEYVQILNDVARVGLFIISLLMLVASVFQLIYFIGSRKSNKNMMTFYKISNLIFSILILAYFIYYMVFSVLTVSSGALAPVHSYIALFTMAILSILPYVIILFTRDKQIEENKLLENDIQE